MWPSAYALIGAPKFDYFVLLSLDCLISKHTLYRFTNIHLRAQSFVAPTPRLIFDFEESKRGASRRKRNLDHLVIDWTEATSELTRLFDQGVSSHYLFFYTGPEDIFSNSSVTAKQCRWRPKWMKTLLCRVFFPQRLATTKHDRWRKPEWMTGARLCLVDSTSA